MAVSRVLDQCAPSVLNQPSHNRAAVHCRIHGQQGPQGHGSGLDTTIGPVTKQAILSPVSGRFGISDLIPDASTDPHAPPNHAIFQLLHQEPGLLLQATMMSHQGQQGSI